MYTMAILQMKKINHQKFITNNTSKMFGTKVNLVLAISYKIEKINEESCKLYYSMYTEIECEKNLLSF